ncbi:MAG TPA: site-2 protease family protein, partial [Verrucomicrobiae bacterium]|nr:site-2 protease family protein [Verrucomicrobiae bacterium]
MLGFARTASGKLITAIAATAAWSLRLEILPAVCHRDATTRPGICKEPDFVVGRAAGLVSAPQKLARGGASATIAAMDMATLRDGLAGYVYLLILLTFHEFAHAWTAWKCGDDTAKNLGRVSLNPVVHMDPVGTVLLPLLFIIIGSKAGVPLFFGWAKPVPVNIHNLRRGRIDDTFIAMAGPAMN